MGLLDKVKAQAEQAMTKAQQGMAQGQAKLDQMQSKRHTDALLRDLGAAVYAEQRRGGANQAVLDALGALDAFAAEEGPIDLTPGTSGTSGAPGTPGAPGPGGFAGPQAAPTMPEGKFTHDDT